MAKLYDGNAKVVEVTTKELSDYQTVGLTPEEIATYFNLEIKVQPDDASFGELTVEIEVSPRECKGKLAGYKQSDIAMQTLAKQHLVKEAKIDNIGEVFESVGKTVAIYQKESVKGEGDDAKHYINTYFSNGAAKLSAAELQKRLAMLTGKKVAPKPAPQNDDPFAS